MTTSCDTCYKTGHVFCSFSFISVFLTFLSLSFERRNKCLLYQHKYLLCLLNQLFDDFNDSFKSCQRPMFWSYRGLGYIKRYGARLSFTLIIFYISLFRLFLTRSSNVLFYYFGIKLRNFFTVFPLYMVS